MYYGHMSKYEILHSSRKFLYAIYFKYVNRACENLGVKVNEKEEDDNTLDENDYPEEFMRFSQKDRDRFVEESGESNEDFLKKFSKIVKI